MPVVGRNVFIISNTGRVVEVAPFTPDYQPMQIPIVGAAIQYDCPYDGVGRILVIRNALHVPSMRHNLMPPFVMREAGIQLRDTPKIQVTSPSEDDHSLYFPDDGFRIPLSLWGVFSYFPSSKPTASMLEHSDDVYLITPERWNPHDEAYAVNEENMLDWEGHMIDRKRRPQVLLSDIPEDDVMAASVTISAAESHEIDRLLERSDADSEETCLLYTSPSPRDKRQSRMPSSA